MARHGIHNLALFMAACRYAKETIPSSVMKTSPGQSPAAKRVGSCDLGVQKGSQSPVGGGKGSLETGWVELIELLALLWVGWMGWVGSST